MQTVILIATCNQFVDGFTWGSVSQATIQMAGEIASTVPGATVAGVPIQIIGDPRVPTVPTSCSSTGVDESNLNALLAERRARHRNVPAGLRSFLRQQYPLFAGLLHLRQRHM